VRACLFPVPSSQALTSKVCAPISSDGHSEGMTPSHCRKTRGTGKARRAADDAQVLYVLLLFR
jgi:hypothetical protein